ncbi:MAG: glycosyltransferase family 2 protein [Pseudomonadota bacterium]
MSILRAKERVIEEQARALVAFRLAFGISKPVLPTVRALAALAKREAGRPKRLVRRCKEILRPRLGNLRQYAPRELRLPRHYFQQRTLAAPPSISLVTPSFSQGDYVRETLRSVLDQHYPALEYFVQDGGSQDGTLDILKAYEDELTGWASCIDDGQAHAVNLAFSRTSGEIMGWLNSDDLLLPGALHYVAEYFVQHPEVDVVYGNRLLIDQNGKEIGRWILPGHDAEALKWADFVPQESLFWRRSLWERVGGALDESFQFAMDWDLLVRFLDAGAKFAHLPRFLGAFRIHGDQKTSNAINETGFKEMARIRERIWGRVPSGIEIRKAITPFMLRHIVADLRFRIHSRLRFRSPA